MTLNEMKKGDKKRIIYIDNKLPIKKRLLDIGFNKNEIIECKLINSFKNLIAYRIKDTTIALRIDDCKKIIVGDINE